jgi:replicative DNA helicase
VAKNRNGPVRTVKLGFQPAYARYRNLARASFDDSPTD